MHLFNQMHAPCCVQYMVYIKKPFMPRSHLPVKPPVRAFERAHKYILYSAIQMSLIILQENFCEIEWDVAISWQLQGLHGTYLKGVT